MFFLRTCCRTKPLAAGLAIIFLCGLSGPGCAWTQTTRIYGPEDRDVPMPSTSPVPGTANQAAEGVLESYFHAVGATQWQGVKATGTITYSGNEAPPQGTATLTIARDGFTRLDVTNSLGSTSFRVRGIRGGFQDVKGTLHTLPFRNARAGLFAYPFLLSPRLPQQQGISLTAGTVQLNGRSFTRLSLARPVIERQTSPRAHGDVIATDVYFSPDTNLPYKSVDLVGALDPSPQRSIRVITYEDYRQVDGVELPFRYTETINGQRSWVLQLTAAEPYAQTDPAYFTF
jgi:hypothetical protein